MKYFVVGLSILFGILLKVSSDYIWIHNVPNFAATVIPLIVIAIILCVIDYYYKDF